MMKLWKISQLENNDYDTYDSAVVACLTEEEAKCMPPTYHEGMKIEEYWNDEGRFKDWAFNLSSVSVEYLGRAAPGVKKGVIVSSFNAG